MLMDGEKPVSFAEAEEETKTKEAEMCTFRRSLPLEPGVEVEVAQRFTGDEGVVVWDAALVLAFFLQRHKAAYKLAEGIQAIELGAGTGAVGISAAALGASCVVTDLEHLLPLIEESIQLNKALFGASKGQAVARALPWGDREVLRDYQKERVFDLVLLADCIYYEKSIEPLVDTILAVSSKPGCKILISYEDRDHYEDKRIVKEKFLGLVENHFDIRHFTEDELHPDFNASDIHVLELTRKQEI